MYNIFSAKSTRCYPIKNIFILIVNYLTAACCSSIFCFASIHQHNSAIKAAALLSVASLSVALPFSSKDFCIEGTGNIAGTTHARIFHRENCKEVITCEPPNIPSETVAMAIGLRRHSSYKKAIAFFLNLQDIRRYTLVLPIQSHPHFKSYWRNLPVFEEDFSKAVAAL